MIAATCRALSRAATFFAVLSAAAFGEVLEFISAIGSVSPSNGEATFLSVEATPPGSPTAPPARAFAGGFFTNDFRFGPIVLTNQGGDDGVLAGLVRTPVGPPWIVEWLLQADSDGGNARITDVAIGPNGDIYVTGIFQGDVSFGGIVLTTPPVGPPEGFVATATQDGEWISAFLVAQMEPTSIAVDLDINIYVTGDPVLARCYDEGGGVIWSRPQPPNTLVLRHIELHPKDEGANEVYVNGDSLNFGGGPQPTRDAFVSQLDRNTGGVNWTTFISSPGEERAGGLGVGPLGNIRTSFSSDQSDNVTVGPDPIQELPTIADRHSHLLFLDPGGGLLDDNLLGTSVAPESEMETSDLAIDHAGNSYVAVSFSGEFVFEGVSRVGSNDAAIVAIDAAGAPMRFTQSAGPPLALGNAVAAPDRDLQILAGGLRGTGQERFDAFNVPAALEERAYFAAIEPAANQAPYILVSPLREPLDLMIQRVNDVGGEVYRAIELRDENVTFVSAFLTEEQLEQLTQFFQPFPDNPLRADGTIESSGYALEALNKAPASNPYSYTYPETCAPTILYLIDSAIDNSSGFFNDNTNLTLGPTTLVREIGDPLTSSKFDHGTEMLSMIAGPTYGAAQGTPITVINYDIYPDGSTARLSALVEAISLANADKALNYPYDPAVYCAASSAATPGASTPTLETVVDYALSNAVYSTIIFSAGNTNGLAEDYTPSDLGSKSGAICAGAIRSDNTLVAMTRSGSAVDLWAPGELVPAANTSGLPTTVTGTSAAAALTAGAALIYLSANPVATPAALETAMTSAKFSQSDTIGTIVQVPTSISLGFTNFAQWSAWYGLTSENGDGDSWSNLEEYHWGLDPLAVDFEGSLVTTSFNRSTSTLTIQFPISCQLYQPSALSAPYTLRDGSTLTIQRSGDLNTWNNFTGSLDPPGLVEVGHSGGQVFLSFEYVVDSPRWFFRARVQ